MRILLAILVLFLSLPQAEALSRTRQMAISSGPLATKHNFDRYVVAQKPTLFIDPSNAASVTADSTRKVSSVASKVNGYTFTQSTAGNKPLISRADNKENLYYYSDQLDLSPWSPTNATVSANAIANPIDGALTAELLTENGAAGNHRIFQTAQAINFINVNYRVSFYAKSNGRDRIRVYSGTPSAEFNLGAVTSTNFGTTISSSIVAVGGDGWYKCSFVAPGSSTAALTTSYYLHDASNNESYTGDGVSGMYLWRAQLQEAKADESDLVTTDHQQYRGMNGQSVLMFDGTDDVVSSTATQANLITASADTIFFTVRPMDVVINKRYYGDIAAGGYRYFPNNGSGSFINSINYDGTSDFNSHAIAAGNTYTLETRHESGTLYSKLNNGTEASTASGDTLVMTGTVQMGDATNPFSGKFSKLIVFNTAKPLAVRQSLYQGLSKF